MQDNISVLLATILFVILIVIFPIYNVASRQDSINSSIVIELTTNFVDTVRNKGYLAADDYAKYVQKLAKTGNMYEIELEAHKKKIVKDKDGLYTEGYEKEFTADILKSLETTGTDIEANAKENVVLSNYYQFNEGDKFYVRLKNTNMTQAQLLLNNIFKGEAESRILVNYGGEIFSEEWARSNLVENTSSNIYISRPMDSTGLEYTNRVVALKADNFAENPEVEYVYGIVVNVGVDMDEVYFYLNYSNVQNVLDVADLRDKITLSGFDGTVSVSAEVENRKYRIAIDDITFEGDKSKCHIKIGGGTAITNAGFEVSSAISPEFILYKDKTRYPLNGELQAIQHYTSPADFDVGTHGYVTKPIGTNPIEIKFTAPTEDIIGRGNVRYIWTISNIGNKPKSVIPKTGDSITWLTSPSNPTGIAMIATNTNEITVTFDEEILSAGETIKGSYVKVVALDSAGVYSLPSGVAFATSFDYLSKGFSTFDVQLSTMALSGATVDSATFNLTVSRGHGTGGRINNGDRYRIIGTDLSERQVILIDKTIEWLKEQYGNKIAYDETAGMYFVDYTDKDREPNGVYDVGEYYVANDITLSGYNTQLGFKTTHWGYGSGSSSEDYSLYYFVENSLVDLQINMIDTAKNKYKYLTFDYKIMAGHGGCLGYSSQKINCTVKSYFGD